MGLMRFLIHPPGRICQATAQQAYLASPDMIPWQSQARFDGRELVIERATAESGNLHVPWPLADRGELVFSTASLMERAKPYQLPLELARGRISLVRGQLFEWQAVGLAPPPDALARIHEAVEAFSVAATCQNRPDESARQAESALLHAVDATDLLCDAYRDQALETRHKQSARLGTFLAASLGDLPLDETSAAVVREAFNTARIACSWRQVEPVEGRRDWSVVDQQVDWCQANRVRLFGGPLLQFGDQGLPDWLAAHAGNVDRIAARVVDYLQAVVARYRGRINLWECAALTHNSQALGLGEAKLLQLATKAIEVIREADPGTPLTVRFVQPWAETMSREPADLSPLHLADALIRAEVGMAGIGLGIELGYEPCGTLARDRLALSRLVDLWNCLGLPIYLTLTVPGGAGGDQRASRQCFPSSHDSTAGWTGDAQAAWVERFVPFLVSKANVQGVVWNQLSDAVAHDLPHGGLIDGEGRVKPAVRPLVEFRKRHLF